MPWRCWSAPTTPARRPDGWRWCTPPDPEWHSQAGGRIDALLRLDVRLGVDEGGPVLDAAGGLLGMSTAGPRRRALVIPAATIDRVLDPLLAEGRIARGWLGVGLQPVMVPDSLREAAGRDSGMMVVSLAAGGPAAAAGVLPGDIMLDLDGTPVRRARALAAAMGPERIGQSRDAAPAAGRARCRRCRWSSRRGPPHDRSRACMCGWR